MEKSGRPPLAVLGAGSWGTALAIHFARQGYAVRLWGRDPQKMASMAVSRVNTDYLPEARFPKNLTVHTRLSDAVTQVNTLFIAVPSHAFRALLTLLVPYVGRQTVCVCCTKGLDTAVQPPQFLYQTAESVLEGARMIVLSGPSFAKELAAGLPTAVTVSSALPATMTSFINCFHTDTFRFYRSSDVIGVQLCGAMKNVLAVAGGIVDGLGLGDSARSALISRGLVEMTALGMALGAKLETFYGLAGVGDLVLTCTSDLSRNRRLGLALGQGIEKEAAARQVGQVVESIGNAEYIYQLARDHRVHAPISAQVHRILSGKVTCADAVKSLLRQPPKVEWGY